MKIICCAGEQARVVLDVLNRAGNDEEVVLLDDDPGTHGERVHGRPVVGGIDELERLSPEDHRCIVALGRIGVSRLDLVSQVCDRGFDLFSVVDPDSTVASTAKVSPGTTINAQSYVGPDVRVDDAVIVDSGAIVSHDGHLAAGVTVAPNATLAGAVSVDRSAYLGAGATVLDHVSIGENAIVGAGAVVTEDVPPEETVVGVPAAPTTRDHK